MSVKKHLPLVLSIICLQQCLILTGNDREQKPETLAPQDSSIFKNLEPFYPPDSNPDYSFSREWPQASWKNAGKVPEPVYDAFNVRLKQAPGPHGKVFLTFVDTYSGTLGFSSFRPMYFYNGSGWDYIGPGKTDSMGFWDYAVSPNNEIYAVTSESELDNEPTSVYKYSPEAGWQLYGSPRFSNGMVHRTSILFTANGFPWVYNREGFFRPIDTSGTGLLITDAIRVYSHGEAGWYEACHVSITGGLASEIPLKLGNDGRPYFNFLEGNDKKYEYFQDALEDIQPFFQMENFDVEDMVVTSDGVPYVMVEDWYATGGVKTKLMKFDNFAWTQVGKDIKDGTLMKATMAITPEDIPIVAYGEVQEATTNLVVVALINNEWTQLGETETYNGGLYDLDLIVTQDGIPVMAYTKTPEYRITVQKFTN